MKTLIIILCAWLITQSANAQEIMLLKTSGKVVIGDTTQISTPGSYNLYVQNGILTERVKVSLKETSDWSDDAFESTPQLSEVAASIEAKSHLPGMPSADSLVHSGYDVTEMDAKLLAQIEWLWQHMIQLNKENEELKAKVQALLKASDQ